MLNQSEQLTTIEETLRNMLAWNAGLAVTATRHAWPAPNEEQRAEMTTLLVRACTELVIGMRDPRALPPSFQEVGEVAQGMALGALERVMGPPPNERRAIANANGSIVREIKIPREARKILN